VPEQAGVGHAQRLFRHGRTLFRHRDGRQERLTVACTRHCVCSAAVLGRVEFKIPQRRKLALRLRILVTGRSMSMVSDVQWLLTARHMALWLWRWRPAQAAA
jgi:hypothetical protein